MDKSKYPSDKSRTGEQASSSGSLQDWLGKNVLNPAVNAVFIEPANAAGKLYDLATNQTGNRRHHIEELPTGQPQLISGQCAEALTQGVVTGLASAIPYAIAGRLAGRFIKAEKVAQIVGAGLYDAARVTQDGETELGNSLGGMAAFSVLEFGRRPHHLPFWKGMGHRAQLGVYSSFAHTAIADLCAQRMPDVQQLGTAMLNGAAMNIVLPGIQRIARFDSKIVRPTERTNPKGISIDADGKALVLHSTGEGLMETSSGTKEIYWTRPWKDLDETIIHERGLDAKKALDDLFVINFKTGSVLARDGQSKIGKSALGTDFMFKNEFDELLDHVPRNSKVIGFGTQRIAFKAPNNSVYVIGPYQERSTCPLVTQPKWQKFSSGDSVQLECFEEVNLSATDHSVVEKAIKLADDAGFEVVDMTPDNIGIAKNGRIMIVDPECVYERKPLAEIDPERARSVYLHYIEGLVKTDPTNAAIPQLWKDLADLHQEHKQHQLSEEYRGKAAGVTIGELRQKFLRDSVSLEQKQEITTLAKTKFGNEYEKEFREFIVNACQEAEASPYSKLSTYKLLLGEPFGTWYKTSYGQEQLPPLHSPTPNLPLRFRHELRNELEKSLSKPIRLHSFIARETVKEILPSECAAGLSTYKKNILEQLNNQVKGSSLNKSEQIDLLLAGLLHTEQPGDTAAFNAAQNALPLLRNLGYSATRTQRIYNLIWQANKLADLKPGDTEQIRQAAALMRSDSSLWQAKTLASAMRSSDTNHHIAKAGDEEWNEAMKELRSSAQEAHTDAIPILTSKLPRQFSLIAPEKYTYTIHATYDMAKLMRFFPLAESPESCLSTSLITEGHQKTMYNTDPNMVLIVEAPPQNVAQVCNDDIATARKQSSNFNTFADLVYSRPGLWDAGSNRKFLDDLSMEMITNLRKTLNTNLEGLGLPKSDNRSPLTTVFHQFSQFENVDDLYKHTSTGSPLRKAHNLITRALISNSDGEPLHLWNEVKIYHPTVSGFGIFRNNRSVHLEGLTDKDTIKRLLSLQSLPDYITMNHEAENVLVVPQDVWRTAQKRRLPLVMLNRTSATD